MTPTTENNYGEDERKLMKTFIKESSEPYCFRNYTISTLEMGKTKSTESIQRCLI
jgi:hypothetical protein